MPRSTFLVAGLLIVAVAILIGAVVLRGGPQLSAAPATANTAAEPDSGLSRAMTFTEPKH